MRKLIFSAVTLAAVVVGGNVAFATDNPLHGKIIALDAGHGAAGDESGAVNTLYGVREADVNLAVVNALEAKLVGRGAYVVITDRVPVRRDRVSSAIEKCAQLDINGDGVADNKKCDVLVSVHHNGNTDPTHDGTLVIYNEKQDIPLAQKLHDALLPITGVDEGYLHGGYGMTVYGKLVSVITEAYYVTNDSEAYRYLYDLDVNGTSNLVTEEADTQLAGISSYFAAQGSGGGKGKNR